MFATTVKVNRFWVWLYKFFRVDTIIVEMIRNYLPAAIFLKKLSNNEMRVHFKINHYHEMPCNQCFFRWIRASQLSNGHYIYGNANCFWIRTENARNCCVGSAMQTFYLNMFICYSGLNLMIFKNLWKLKMNSSSNSAQAVRIHWL